MASVSRERCNNSDCSPRSLTRGCGDEEPESARVIVNGQIEFIGGHHVVA